MPTIATVFDKSKPYCQAEQVPHTVYCAHCKTSEVFYGGFYRLH